MASSQQPFLDIIRPYKEAEEIKRQLTELKNSGFTLTAEQQTQLDKAEEHVNSKKRSYNLAVLGLRTLEAKRPATAGESQDQDN